MSSKGNVASITNCTGCGLCESLCPKKAISMRFNEDGFLAPCVDDTLCSECGLCLKKCIIADNDAPKKGSEEPAEYYAAWNQNSAILKQSSSGGVFSAVADFVLERGGCVFGVHWKDKETAAFTCVRDKDKLEDIRGSKYIPAIPDHVYRHVQEELKKGLPVLFSGTSCQVYALRTFLRKPYDNLYTLDIVCHGVPSHNIFKKYIHEYESQTGKEIRQIDFRNKIIDWINFSMCRNTTSGTKTQVVFRDDDFMKMFLRDLALNTPCYNCPFITHGRQGDLSMGDFWGIQAFHPEWPIENGISVVLANTKKGRKLLLDLQDKLHLESVTQDMIEPGAVYTIPFKQYPKRELPKQRPEVLRWLNTPDIPLSKVVNRFIGGRALDAFHMNSKNVAVLGFWYGLNYGAVMTSLALYRIIERLGYHPTLIDCTGFPGIPATDRDENSVFRQFIRNQTLSTTAVLSNREELDQLNKIFPNYVVGSDQLWRHDYTLGLGHFFFLDFVDARHRKIAYGTSIGTNPCKAPEWFRLRAADLLESFIGISSREQDGVEVLLNQYKHHAKLVLDPVFLADKSDWDACIHTPPTNAPQEDYVFSYILDASEEKNSLVARVAEREKAQLVSITDARQLAQLLNNTSNLPTPGDWLYHFKHCKHVVTDSFHGLCFAIIFNKPFTVISNKERGHARFTSLLSNFGLTNYLLETVQDLEKLERLPAIDWESINAQLAVMRADSIQWLAEKLNTPVDSSRTTRARVLARRHAFEDHMANEVNGRSHELYLLIAYPQLRKKYYKYKILSLFTFGKKRKKYRRKAKALREHIKEARNARRKYLAPFFQ